MSIIDVRYSMPGANLEKEDAEGLWKELDSLFQPKDRQNVSSLRRRVTITTGRGSNEEQVGGEDLGRILNGGFLRDVVTKLAFSFLGQYKSPEEIRSLTLIFDEEEEIEVRVRGEEDWIDRVRGRLDLYLREKMNKYKRYWWTVEISVTLLLGAPLSLIAIKYFESQGTQPLSVYVGMPIFVLMVTAFLSSTLASTIFPQSRLHISSTGIPWYVRWAEQITIGLIVGMLLVVGAVVASFLAHLI